MGDAVSYLVLAARTVAEARSCAAYDGLLTADERAALIAELPADWAIPDAA